MNDESTSNHLRVLALALLSLMFIIDLMAVHQLFRNWAQIAIFGAVLAIQTLMIVAYHHRCLNCEGCMEKAGPGIYLFYKIFAAIGFFSMLIILLSDFFRPEHANLKILVALTYAALLISGASTAFNAIIGVRNVAGCATKQKSATDQPEQRAIKAKAQEIKTLADWESDETVRRGKSLQTQQKQAADRAEAKKRIEQRLRKQAANSAKAAKQRYREVES